MRNLQGMEDIIAKMIANQSKSPYTAIDAQAIMNEQTTLENIYSQTVVPIYQMLHILYADGQINSEQFNNRLASLAKLLRLLEELLPEEAFYQYIAIIQVKDVREHQIFLKIIQGLLQLNHVYPVVTDFPISSHTIRKLTNPDTNEVSNFRRLSLIHSIAHRPPKNLMNLKYAKIKVVRPYEMDGIIQLFPYLIGQPFNVVDCLF